MVVFLRAAAFALAAAVVVAQNTQPKCDPNNKCPTDSPCCSSYGQCGTGAYCLGGCDPLSSFNLQSCMPASTCKSGDFKMDSLDDIVANTAYLGDNSEANWVSSGTPAVYQNQALLLTMAPNTVGTLLSSTHYVWYGKVSASLTTSQGAGVVTAFILMSDVKDEIDFEFVGVDLEHAQSNFYYHGITNYQNGGNLTVSNTAQNTHTYEIDWTPEQIDWSVDGRVLRTLKKSDTYNETTKNYHYPQTPARVQLSLWPAGLSSNGTGTIEWSGGLVDWNSPLMENGYYYAMVNDVSIDCYDPPSGAKINGQNTYSYTDTAGTEGSVQMGNGNTILASFQANGNNQQFNPNAKVSASASASGTSSSAAARPTQNDNTVPGISGVGSFGNDAASNSNGQTGEDSTTGGAGSSTSGSSSGSGSGSTGGTGSGGFSQGTTSNQSEGTRVVAGSLVALVAFFAAAMMI